MYNIAFYISDHEFGHTSRNIPIINYILNQYKNVKVIVKTGEAQGFFMKKLLNQYNDRIIFYLKI